ncbi:CPBP family intramembrane glutamic endopeptidase [Metabacillus iocasae]|uniref:Membrane protease YdiL (CAAX protease family) n=1 Tax=Priestia iocasae TaxID=2291674 RepID=A0ABS2QTY6_9BACI|nr:CPBP family intramembrane glutamic endopeptidase [Metabacillus iocasae]MBM7702943.1 membrane protease YdiL (CAAX protease family) [Metabacillus iocasae]
MDKQYSKRDEVVAGFVLGGLSLSLTGALLFWYIRNPEGFVKERLGIHANAFDYPLAWLVSIVVVVGYVMYTSKVVPFVRDHLMTFSWLKVIGIWAAIVSSTVEEILFRQALMDWLMNKDYSVILQIILSAAAFGLAHGAWVLLKGQLKIALPVILSTTVLGGLLAILYIMSGRQILVPIVAHMLINLAIEPWLILSAVSGKWEDQPQDQPVSH